MKPWTEEKERKPNTVTQSRRVLRKKSLRSATDLSKSSKCRLFLSLQMHHIKQWGTAIQIDKFWCLPNFPCQQANRSTTIYYLKPTSFVQLHNSEILQLFELISYICYYFNYLKFFDLIIFYETSFYFIFNNVRFTSIRCALLLYALCLGSKEVLVLKCAWCF